MVVVDVRGEQVMSCGNGTAAEQERLGVPVHRAVFEKRGLMYTVVNYNLFLEIPQ